MNNGKVWTPEEVASMLHVFPTTIVDTIQAGELAAIEVNGDYLITDEAMREFMRVGNPFQRISTQLPQEVSSK